MLKINVPNTVKFSYQYTRGSYTDSVKYAQNIINETICEFIDMGYPENITINKIKKIMKKVLPEKRRIDIKPFSENNPKLCGSQDYLSEQDIITGREKYIGFMINIPNRNGRFSLDKIPILIHEFTHVLNVLFTPKYTAQFFKTESTANRINRCSNNIKKFSRIYNKYYNNSLLIKEDITSKEDIPDIIKKRHKELTRLLRSRTSEERIIILQNYRYFLQSEKCAYESEKSLYKLLSKYGLKCDEEVLELDSSEYLLDEKIQMLKGMCYKEIQKIRGNLR